jgi:hypothetical protein
VMLFWNQHVMDAGLIFVMREQAANRSSDQLNRFEQVSNLLLLSGVVALFFGSGNWFMLGLLAAGLGVCGILGTLSAKRANWHTLFERLMIIGMLLGIVGMFQARFIQLYEYGFYMLGLCTLGFIIILHVPKPQAA